MRALVNYLLLASWVCASTAGAQAPQQVVEDLNRDAMEAYNNLDIERAGSMLEEALRVATEAGVQGPLLALTNLNMGIIYIGGLGDNDGGLGFFVAALCADPSTQLDPLTSTPDIQSVFQVAQQQAQAGSCPSAGGAAPPAAVGAPIAMAEAVVHHSPPEQLSQSPLPLYVEVSQAAHPKKVHLYYKGLGMDSFKRVDMFNYGSGFAYQISCNDVWEPKVTYYIEAVGEGGQPIGSAGTAAAPIEVPIVSARTQGEPALPGAESPGTCKEEECPPGLSGCEKPGTFGIGEECERTKDCQSGLACDDDVCVLKGAGSTDASEAAPSGGEDTETPWGDSYDDDEDKDKGEFRRFFFNVGFNVGFSYVKSGMEADHAPPDNRVFQGEGPVDPATNTRAPLGFADPAVPALDPLTIHNSGGRIILPDGANYPTSQTAWVPDADSGDSLLMEPGVGPYGGDCPADGIETDPFFNDPSKLYPSKYCVRVKKPGFVPGMGIRLNIGYFLSEHFALSIPVRIQFSHGTGTLAGVLIGLRGEYQWLKPKATGIFFSNYLGFTVGQIQAQPPADNASDDAPWAISGPVGAHLGLYLLRYRMHPNFGLISSAELDIQFPNFLMNIDWTAIGAEASF
jgi:hypothetical protein